MQIITNTFMSRIPDERRKALGRSAFLGSLYDASTDNVFASSILQKSLPQKLIKRVDVHNTNLQYNYTDSQNLKMESLNVEGQLKLSVLAGLFNLEGSGKYLTDEKKSKRSVKGSLIYKIATCEQHINIYDEETKRYISHEAIMDDAATHMIAGIRWGANVVASFEQDNLDEKNVTHTSGILKAHLEKIAYRIEGKANVGVSEETQDITRQFSVKVFGDIHIGSERIPQNYEEVLTFFTKVPDYVSKANNGLGVPIEFILYPLPEIRKLAKLTELTTRTLHTIQEDMVLSVAYTFDDILLSKQLLNDLGEDVRSVQKYIPSSLIDKVTDYRRSFETEEATFRSKISKYLVEARLSGNVDTLKGLISSLNKFSKHSVENFVNLHAGVTYKAETLRRLPGNTSYLGIGDTILECVLRHPETENIYFILDYDDMKTNPSLYSKNYNMFTELQANNAESLFFIVDVKNCNFVEGINKTSIYHYIRGLLSTRDYYDENKLIFESNTIRFKGKHNIRHTMKPENKSLLEISCPLSFKNICTNEPRKWICVTCKKEIEYGYNEYVYCMCGEIRIYDSEFKCNDLKHPREYIQYDNNTLNDVLPSAPPQEVNILLLGSTGVGKSTFINAFVNYLCFDSLKDAINGNMQVMIDSSFTMTDKEYTTRNVSICNNDDDNENTNNQGGSSTQQCRSYTFSHQEKQIRIIDTPGIGDTRGIEQDKRNFDNILKYISYYKNISGICILLKPNDARLNIVFRFCIQELLSHIHKSAKENIVFCFTNSRGTFYRPGDTLVPLRKLLRDLETKSGVSIPVCKETMYCFDNESFRFLAALKSGIDFDDGSIDDYENSWNTSIAESERLIKYICSLPLHLTKDTTSLNDARKIVVRLAKPLAEISRNIQVNISATQDHKKEVENTNANVEELKSKLYVPTVDLRPIALKHPRTVCTSVGCREVITVGDTTKMNYKTHCHIECYLTGVEPNVINNAALRQCSSMQGTNNTCTHCGCSWEKHMHTTYDNEEIEVKVVSKSVQSLINAGQLEAKTKIAHIEILQERVDQLKKEQHIITEINIKFAHFLRQNAMAVYNDAYADYLDLLIREEESKRGYNPDIYDDRILNNLTKEKEQYAEQVKILSGIMIDDGTNADTISPDEIASLEHKLYNLTLSGETLKKIKDQIDRGIDMNFKYSEKACTPSLFGKLKFWTR